MRNTTRHLVSTAVILGIISVSYMANAEHPATLKNRAEKAAMARMDTCKKQLGCDGLKKNNESYEACMIKCVEQEQATKEKTKKR